MTEQGQQVAAIWQEPEFAQSWAEHDLMSDMLGFPRRMAAAIIAGDNPEPGCIVDIASGPGAMLAVLLEQFGSARGIWTDTSPAMLELARQRLAAFGDRVEYQLVDMTDLAAAEIPAGVDVITTSRAAHHLDPAGLTGFYRQAASLLAPGGWLVNLDHIGPVSDAWDARLRSARDRFRVSPPGPSHRHSYPLPSVSDHLAGYTAAGITDVEVAWRAFVTCLFMGRRERERADQP